MELSELQKIWNTHSLKVAENTKINKRILKEMLIRKPSKTINWIKLKAIYQLIAGVVILILFFKDVKLRDPGLGLYIGITLLALLLLFSFIRGLKSVMLLISINMANPILIVKGTLLKFQKYKLSTMRYNFFITPPSFLAVILLTPIQFYQQQIILPILFFMLVYVIFSFYRFKFINEEFDNLNRQLAELEHLEE